MEPRLDFEIDWHELGLDIAKAVVITILLALTVPGVTVGHAIIVFLIMQIGSLKVDWNAFR